MQAEQITWTMIHLDTDFKEQFYMCLLKIECQEPTRNWRASFPRVQEDQSIFTKIISLFLSTYLNWSSQDFKWVSGSVCTASFRRDLLSGNAKASNHSLDIYRITGTMKNIPSTKKVCPVLCWSTLFCKLRKCVSCLYKSCWFCFVFKYSQTFYVVSFKGSLILPQAGGKHTV